MPDLGLLLRRITYHIRRAFYFFRVGSWNLAEVRQDALTLWAVFNVDDELVTIGLFPWEEDILNPAVRAGQHVLVIGCGSGRDSIPLIARGAIVSGIDPSAEALAAMRRELKARGLSASITQGFVEDVEIAERFDLIYFSYYCYSYIPVRERRVAVLRKVAGWLKPGGQLVVSAPPGWGVSAGLRLIARLAGALYRTDWRFERDDHVWLANTPTGLGHYQHVFRKGDLEDEVRAAGLTVQYRNPEAVLAMLAPHHLSE